MVNLVVDVGNTNTKLFLFECGKIISQYRYSNNNIKIDRNSLNEILKKNIKYCIISKVKDIDNDFLSFLQDNFKVVFLNYKMLLPVTIEYKTPETLGLDRLAAVSGASFLYPDRNILIIDAGTAITYDFLTADKNYLGGCISPGVLTRFKSLHTFTGKLPLLNANEKINGLYGDSTEKAIILGVQNGIIYEVMGIIKEFESVYDNLLIIFTGGDAIFFEKLLKICIFVEPNLTAIGLNKILELNV